MTPDLLEGLQLPAWIVALALAAYLGARAVIMVRASSNGGGRRSTDAPSFDAGADVGAWRQELRMLIHRQSDVLQELREVLRGVLDELKRRDTLENRLAEVLDQHQAQTSEAIGLVEEIHKEVVGDERERP